MAIPAGYAYHDGAYWYITSGPFFIGEDDVPFLAPYGSQGPVDTNYRYRDGAYWHLDGAGPYVRDLAGNFFLAL